MKLATATVAALLLGGAAIFAPDVASAHPHGYHNDHYRYGPVHRAAMPRWLRRNHAFRHWYWRNQYRFGFDISWRRLYRHYERDRRHHNRHGYRKGRRYDDGHHRKRRKHRHRRDDD